MKNFSYILIFLLLAHGLSVMAQEKPDWEKEFKELCAYDKMCTILKSGDDKFIAPKAPLVITLSHLKESILETSQALGIDPHAIPSAILAENSLNVTIDSDAREFIQKIKALPIAHKVSQLMRGKSFSLGLGQIKPESAADAEPLLAKLEKRPERDSAEINTALLNPIESIKYAGGIIKLCQDKYAAAGFDVSKDVPILASLYNLGGCPVRASKAKASGQNPKINYFGFFVKIHLEDIKKGLGLDVPIPQNTATMAADVPAVRKFTDSVQLTGFPPFCAPNGAGTEAEYFKTQTLKLSPVKVAAKGEFTQIGQGID